MQRIVPVNTTAPAHLWSGERDDEALRRLAEEHGFRGAAQRVLAALDSVGSGG
jgi:hypothetical protein